MYSRLEHPANASLNDGYTIRNHDSLQIDTITEHARPNPGDPRGQDNISQCCAFGKSSTADRINAFRNLYID